MFCLNSSFLEYEYLLFFSYFKKVIKELGQEVFHAKALGELSVILSTKKRVYEYMDKDYILSFLFYYWAW